VADVAPLMAVPFFRHWYVRGAEPLAPTLKVAVAPAFTVALAGWVVMAGGVFTVKIALLEVVLPAAFATTTRKVAPLSPATVAGVV